MGEVVPITHALFLPMDDALPNAPYPVVGQSGLPDAVTLRHGSEFVYDSSENRDLELAGKEIGLKGPIWEEDCESDSVG